MLEIAIGHQLSVITSILGDFASISATTAIQYPTATLFDADRNPTSKTVPVTTPDHVAFTGIFKSGVFSSVTWRGGIKSTPGRKQLIWEIDGEEGSVRMEGDQLGAAFMNIFDPKLYLNGEIVEVKNTSDRVDNIAAGWAEFAKGEEGDYRTFEDGVKIHRVMDAILRSAKGGKMIRLE